MPIIKSIEIWGFFSYFQPVKIELAEGLTVITGPSGAGKSTILRLVKWITLGEPEGEAFIFTVMDEATGEIIKKAEEAGGRITLTDGRSVTKTRSKGKTKYVVSGYDQAFEKAAVPEAVTEMLGIVKQSYQDFTVTLNFAYQLDTPFLLSEPGSAGAKVLGKLAGTESVDGAIRDTAKDAYKARADMRDAEHNREDRDKKLFHFQDLDGLREQIDAAAYLIEQADIAGTRLNGMNLANSQLVLAAQKLEAATERRQSLAVVESLIEDMQKIEKAQQRYNTLLDLFEKLSKATATVEALTEQLKAYESLELAEVCLGNVRLQNMQLTKLCSLFKEYQIHSEKVNTAEEMLKFTKDLDIANVQLKAVEESVSGRLSNLKIAQANHIVAKSKFDRIAGILERITGIEEVQNALEFVELEYERLLKLYEIKRFYGVKSATLGQAVHNLEVSTADVLKYESQLAATWASVDICPLCEQGLTGHLSH